MIKNISYCLGLDVSTQGAKLVLLDYCLQKPVFTTAVNYDKDLLEYSTLNGVIKGLGTGVSESDPQMWLDALYILFKRLKGSGFDPAKIKAISVSGQQHGLVCLDKEGNLTRKTSKLWNDVSTVKECEELTDAVGGKEKMLKAALNTQKPGYTAGKILHFKKHEPKAFAKTSALFLVHNYINWFLTGGKNSGVRVMEPGDVSGMALWNPIKKTWAKNVCNAISGDLIKKLPPVKPADEFIGRISPELCAKYGFSPDCMIDAGSGDNMYGALGTGNAKEGIVTISLGTSGTACTFLKRPYISEDGEIASYCDSTGNYLPLLCVSNLANGYNEIINRYKLSHEKFAGIIRKTKPGNSGKILLPWFIGERTPNLPHARPMFFGFGLGDFTKEILCRAVLEGHVMNLYEGYTKFPIKADVIHLTGGMSKSPEWRRTIADIFEADVIPVKGEGAALGAAIHAAWTDNKKTCKKTVSDFVNQFIEFDEKNLTKPSKENKEIYKTFKKTYLAVSKRIRGIAGSDDPFSTAAKM